MGIVELMSRELIGHASVDVRWLDVGRPVVGTFPITSPGGLRIASLDAHLDVLYGGPGGHGVISSFELTEHMAALQAAAAALQPNVQGPWPASQPLQQGPAGAQGLMAVEQLDLFEVLHQRLSR